MATFPGHLEKLEQASLKRPRLNVEKSKGREQARLRPIRPLGELFGVEANEVSSEPIALEDRRNLRKGIGVSGTGESHVPFQPSDLCTVRQVG